MPHFDVSAQTPFKSLRISWLRRMSFLWARRGMIAAGVMMVGVWALPLAAQDQDEPQDEAEAAEDGDAPPAQDLETLGARRIDMAPMNIPIFDRNRMVARVNVELIIQVRDIVDVEEARLRLPQLRADFLTALNQLSRERFRVGRPIEPNLIQHFVTIYANRRLGAGKIDVYVKQAYIQPL